MRAKALMSGAAALIIATGVAVAADDERSADGANSRARSMSGSREALLVHTTDGAATLDTDSGSWTPRSGGIVVPGTSTLVTVASKDGSTTVTAVDLTANRETAGPAVAGEFVATVVSGSGRLAALSEPREEGATPWLPNGRRITNLVIAPIGASGGFKKFELRGNYEPEAFSTDDQTLFLIKYIPAMAPSRYSVRRLNLRTGSITPIARLKLAAPGVMRGTGRMQVLAPDESQLYTLYTQQGPNYAHGPIGDHDRGRIHAFVHVLDLSEKWAHCIDLPMPFGTGRATASAVTVSPGGDRVYVTDWTNGVIAAIDPARVSLLRVHEIDLGGRDDATFASATDEILYVAGNAEVVAVETSTMNVVGRWEAAGEIVGLAPAPSGQGVYVATGRGVELVDAALSETLRSWPASDVAGIAHVFETSAVTP